MCIRDSMTICSESGVKLSGLSAELSDLELVDSENVHSRDVGVEGVNLGPNLVVVDSGPRSLSSLMSSELSVDSS